MRITPQALGLVHFVGIGGIGMSGIAEVMHQLGYRVQGSDQNDGSNVQRLRDKGITVFVGHRAEQVTGAGLLIVSTAINESNPEIRAARNAEIPIIHRAEMLAELMRLRWAIGISGTHGKTTTTTMVGMLLQQAGFSPTIINGGIINELGTNAIVGQGDWMVVETDESDGSFLRLPATVGVVTNIDPEHMNHFGSFDKVKDAYRQFVLNLPFYGFAVMCSDHPVVADLISRIDNRRIISYGFAASADVRAENVRLLPEGARFDVVINQDKKTHHISDVFLAMVGSHNVQNALAAIAIAHEMGIGDAVIKACFASFKGIKRRFTKTGEVAGISIYDDYGHHPTEIAAVLRAARTITKGRVIAVVQPHRYSRLKAHFSEFVEALKLADCAIISDVYAAGEAPIVGADREALVLATTKAGHPNVHSLSSPNQLADSISKLAASGDVVICLGAGSITNWANALPAELATLLQPSGRVIAV